MRIQSILKTCVFLTLGTSQAQTPAAEPQYKIRQIIQNKNIVVAVSTSTETLDRGKIFLATFSDNTQCPLKVIGQNKNNITFDTSECEKARSLTLQQSIEPSLHMVDEVESEILPTSNKKTKMEAPMEDTRSPIPVRTISDQSFLLPAGKLSLVGTFAASNEEYSFYSGSTLSNNVKIRRNLLGMEVAYGFTDSFNMFIGLTLVPGEQTEQSALDTTSYSKGFEDPDLVLAYRLIGQTDTTPLDVQLKVQYTPQTFEAKTATDLADGTVASGRNVLGIQLGAFRRFRAVELGFFLDYISHFSGTTTNAENNETTERGAAEAMLIQGISQFKISDGFFLSAGLGIASFSSGEAKNMTTGTLTRTSAYTVTGLQLGARTTIIPDTALLEFTIRSEAASNPDVTQGNTKLTIKDMRRSTIGAGVKYVF